MIKGAGDKAFCAGGDVRGTVCNRNCSFIGHFVFASLGCENETNNNCIIED